MIEKGRVISIDNGRALVSLLPSEKCAQCRLCSLDGPGGRTSLEVDAVEGLRPGHEVSIRIDSGEVLKGGWTVFILPLIAFIVGAAAAPDLSRILGLSFSKELASFLLGGVLLGVTFLGIYLRARSPKYQKRVTPTIVDFK
jgi:positive regulator of sigma E activity